MLANEAFHALTPDPVRPHRILPLPPPGPGTNRPSFVQQVGAGLAGGPAADGDGGFEEGELAV
ncbi:MAG: hypothetical protein JWM19_6268 [Actinomycetia bacterium]|nr:hypothetical protein [Actinomycetes bacterium]